MRPLGLFPTTRPTPTLAKPPPSDRFRCRRSAAHWESKRSDLSEKWRRTLSTEHSRRNHPHPTHQNPALAYLGLKPSAGHGCAARPGARRAPLPWYWRIGVLAYWRGWAELRFLKKRAPIITSTAALTLPPPCPACASAPSSASRARASPPSPSAGCDSTAASAPPALADGSTPANSAEASGWRPRPGRPQGSLQAHRRGWGIRMYGSDTPVSTPFWALFPPFFRRFSALSGFLAPRRRERAKDGGKWAKNGRNRGAETPQTIRIPHPCSSAGNIGLVAPGLQRPSGVGVHFLPRPCCSSSLLSLTAAALAPAGLRFPYAELPLLNLLMNNSLQRTNETASAETFSPYLGSLTGWTVRLNPKPAPSSCPC
eukprot:COSAG04_NODE_3613_length_2671_cov_1.506998_2_plen_370_part_00